MLVVDLRARGAEHGTHCRAGGAAHWAADDVAPNFLLLYLESFLPPTLVIGFPPDDLEIVR
jgi:hypothetical protein